MFCFLGFHNPCYLSLKNDFNKNYVSLLMIYPFHAFCFTFTNIELLKKWVFLGFHSTCLLRLKNEFNKNYVFAKPSYELPTFTNIGLL
jgi:hypothetical protein